jgi:hypothetical protein
LVSGPFDRPDLSIVAVRRLGPKSVSRKALPMPVIYKFSSSVTNGLFAFAGDADGSMLPEKHGPWETKGGIRPGEPIPHRLDRETVERAIDDHGFQLWRMKKPLVSDA